ncbi:MAG: M23 family metallopeptidase [Clostridiales bacterium]|nr:M23 family metallopeptidase [Clostridiales bacterium]
MTPTPNAEHTAAADAARAARRSRCRASAIRTRRARQIALATVATFSAIAALWWTWPTGGAASSGDASGSSHTATESVAEMFTTPAPPTPIFGHGEGIELHLAVAEEDLTEIGFHRAARDNAFVIESYLPDADMKAADENRGTGRVPARVDTGATEPRILGGTVLRMWRSSRPGPPNTAVDIGAAPGSVVFAPISGTITAITPYSLYGEHDDIEIHIQPTGRADLDLVMIHVENISVSVGDQVLAGVTPIARVRLLSDRIDHQLGQYCTSPGDHVHIQLNRVETPGQTIPTEGS